MLVLIPIIAMLSLEFIVSGKRKPSAKTLLSMMGCGILFLIALRLVLPTAWIYPEGEATMRVRAQVTHLLSVKDWQKKPVLIVEGSSTTSYGINGRALEQILNDHGVPVTVLQFSMLGASHFERLFMLQLFFQELGKQHQQELRQAPTILLSEVLESYDQEPLFTFRHRGYTNRSIEFLSPWNAYLTWKTSCKKNTDDAFLRKIVKASYLNVFLGGIFSSFQPLNYRKQAESFCPKSEVSKTFNYTKKATDLKNFLRHPPATSAVEIPSEGWSLYYQELYQEYSDTIHSLVFFPIPTLQPSEIIYQTAFSQHLPPSTMMLGPLFRDRMTDQLLQEKNWSDELHLHKTGTSVFTQWLADQIIEHWSQILATPWKKNTTR
ncbi:MAG: hypothetical protein K2W97_01050 [Chthoniobacterales bacterium]|nr:hypothetical protein [Chthoniobacterales bacterium]